ncbi:MAG: ferrochelatase [Halobacteriota archaeon]
MTTGVVLLNFGEPEEISRDVVVPYLERIFLSNMEMEEIEDEEAARERAHQLAERRAPGLLEEYREMGPSPLKQQAREQRQALEQELRDRGFDVEAYDGMQYTEPFVKDALLQARDDGVDELVALPVYPLCGRTTTEESLEMTSEALDELDWNPAYHEVSGWHEHPDYVELRADNLREFVEGRGLTLGEDAELVFSAHGTPVKYLEDGSRYRDYVEEFCEWIADRLEVDDYLLGYQNHENRDVEWTQPDTEDVVEEVDAPNVVVEPLSFMREQSETLSELDLELREECDEAGVELHRVPIPHDDPRFAGVLADLVEPLLTDDDLEDWGMGLCRCRETDRTYCYGPADD